MEIMIDNLAHEAGKYALRKSSLAFARFVELAGGRMRVPPPSKTAKSSSAAGAVPSNGSFSAASLGGTPPGSFSAASGGSSVDAGVKQPPPAGWEFDNIWPLQLVDLKDSDHFRTLFKLLRRLPDFMCWWLNEFVFPVTMEYQGQKLSASGQEIGGVGWREARGQGGPRRVNWREARGKGRLRRTGRRLEG